MSDTKYPYKVVRVNKETGDRLTVGVFVNLPAASTFMSAARPQPHHRYVVESDEA